MVTRVLTGLVLAPLLVWLLVAGPTWLVVTVVAAAAAQGAAELLAMFAVVDRATRALTVVVVAGVVVAAGLAPALTLPLAGIGATLLLASCLRRPDDLPRQAQRAALAGLGLAYIGAMGAALAAIAATPAPDSATAASAFGQQVPHGHGALLAHFLVVFCGDTGAYFAGRLAGRHKLYPLVSPKKTVEGGIGGLLLGCLGLWAYTRWWWPALSPALVIAAAAVLGVVAQVGDFAESMFKRATDTKDSGTLLPGHGGMLDRVDGVLFAAPWTLLALQALAP